MRTTLVLVTIALVSVACGEGQSAEEILSRNAYVGCLEDTFVVVYSLKDDNLPDLQRVTVNRLSDNRLLVGLAPKNQTFMAGEEVSVYEVEYRASLLGTSGFLHVRKKSAE